MSNNKISSFINKLLSVNDSSNPSLTHWVSEDEIVGIIQQAMEIVLQQPIMLDLMAPLKICGDIHGQYPDLLRIFNRAGYPPDTNYLFLGDYVDRGRQQLEVICLLMGYKILYPLSFFILRGNHECASINRTYGFYEECKRRYSVVLYNAFQPFFNSLPLCAVVESRIFCMHGGLSPQLTSWSQMADSLYKRPFDPPNKCIATDLLWADPDKDVAKWEKSTRGVSFVFGAEVVKKFCKDMDIDLIVRGHQVVEDGYEFFADRKLVTVFSAPKYCGEFDNSAAIMTVTQDLTCSFETLVSKNTVPKIRAPYKKKTKSQQKAK